MGPPRLCRPGDCPRTIRMRLVTELDVRLASRGDRPRTTSGCTRAGRRGAHEFFVIRLGTMLRIFENSRAEGVRREPADGVGAFDAGSLVEALQGVQGRGGGDVT